MPLELQDVHFSDGNDIQNVYISAFINDRLNQTLFPGMSFDKLIAGSASRWPRNYGDLSTCYKKVIDTDTGEVVGYSKWAFENTTAGGQLQRPIGMPKDLVLEPPSTPEGLNDPFAIHFTAKCRAIREKHLRDQPALRLGMMGTLPAYQRRGVASLQLAWATELADREGLIMYTEGSPVATPLYEKFGFEPVGEVVSDLLDGGSYTYTCLLRKPKGA